MNYKQVSVSIETLQKIKILKEVFKKNGIPLTCTSIIGMAINDFLKKTSTAVSTTNPPTIGANNPSSDALTREDRVNITGTRNSVYLESSTSGEDTFNDQVATQQISTDATNRTYNTEKEATPPLSETGRNSGKPTEISANEMGRTPPSHGGSVAKISKLPFGEFQNVYLSDEEYTKLTDKLGLKANDLIEELSAYIKSQNIKKYKDHYAVLLNWSRREKNNTQKTFKQIDRDERTAFFQTSIADEIIAKGLV